MDRYGERDRRFAGRHFIAGQWRNGDDREPSINPSNPSDCVGLFPQVTPAEASEAVDSARAAFPAWSRSNIQFRSDVLRSTGDRLLASADELGRLLAREEGKLFPEARAEILRSAQIFHYFAGEPMRRQGRFGAGLRDGFNVIVEHEPLGVVSLITPWNFPMAVPAWKVAAALAYGNTVVLKPSEYTPACAVALTEILMAAGLPSGVLNLVLGRGAGLGDILTAQVDGLSFTGSTPVGQALLAQAAPAMTKVQLELGGKNPLLVLDDADIDQAVAVALDGAFGQTGQRCTATSRIIVCEKVHDRFAETLAERTRALRVGDAFDAKADLGPVATEAQLGRNIGFVAETLAAGGQLLAGGQPVGTGTNGYFFQPALFLGTNGGMRLNREEVFGPVVGVIKVADLDEGLAVANDAAYALSAGVCTRSLVLAEHFRRGIRAGMAMINAPTAGVDYHVPFGGRAPSAYGAREQGQSAADFFTETKTSYVNHGVTI